MNRLGFGTLRLPMIQTSLGKQIDYGEVQAMVPCALDLGITYFDCAPTYCDGQCEETFGRLLNDIRYQVKIGSKIPLDVLNKPGDLRIILESSLKRLQTDYLDYYYFWGIKKSDFEKVAINRGFLKEMKEMKEEGLIRNMGFSFHDQPEYALDIVQMAKAMDCPLDMMLCQYNLLDRSMEEYITRIKKHGLLIFVMGAAAGGKLKYELSYPFVWHNPNVDCLVSGVQSVEMIRKNVELLKNTKYIEMAEIEKEEKRQYRLKALYCTGCGYCMPCPYGIDIPAWMNIRQLESVYDKRDISAQMFERYLKNNKNPMDVCMDCGLCEKRCPQKLHIRNFLRCL